ncbi:MAG: HigA family addiction module antidote protein [Xanthomonadales bacterium]|nr:HigA family addiction module antidote protein [Xanthomonadales bacterium]
MNMYKAAETFAPGEFLKDELEARHWTQTELAEIMGRPVRLVNEIIAGKKAVTPETAVQLGDALGTGPELWMNLESQYQLSKVQSTNGLVARRAQLYGRFPVREMIKRGWVAGSKTIDVLEQQFIAFFGIAAVNDEPSFCHAAKKTQAEIQPTMQQLAWLFRARQLASQLVVRPYQATAMRQALPRLSALRSAPRETRHVASIMAECGIRFVVIEPIPGSKIDGACFWLPNDQPVIALSLRLDRIDNFWFVLRHEIEHVLQQHGRDRAFILDQDRDAAASEQMLDEELVANRAAAEFCVPESEISDFVARVGPPFPEHRMVLFANRIHVHPGLAAGQLQRRLGRYDLYRKHLVKVRSFVTASALADGWGHVHSN